MKKGGSQWFHISMLISNSQNFSDIINTLPVHLFPAILEGILFGGISSEGMVELETARHLDRIKKSLLYTTYNKILMEHYFPARAMTTAYIAVNGFHQFSSRLSKALITC